jgi:alkylhydroperoxidase family enzyme
MRDMDDLRAISASIPADARTAAYLDKVRSRAYEVSDADIAALKEAGVSEDEIFEQTVGTAIAEGLRRWDAAEKAIG